MSRRRFRLLLLIIFGLYLQAWLWRKQLVVFLHDLATWESYRQWCLAIVVPVLLKPAAFWLLVHAFLFLAGSQRCGSIATIVWEGAVATALLDGRALSTSQLFNLLHIQSCVGCLTCWSLGDGLLQFALKILRYLLFNGLKAIGHSSLLYPPWNLWWKRPLSIVNWNGDIFAYSIYCLLDVDYKLFVIVITKRSIGCNYIYHLLLIDTVFIIRKSALGGLGLPSAIYLKRQRRHRFFKVSHWPLASLFPVDAF